MQKHSVLITRHRSLHPYIHILHISHTPNIPLTRDARPPPVPADPTYLHRGSGSSNARLVRFAQSALLQIFLVVRNALKILYIRSHTNARSAPPISTSATEKHLPTLHVPSSSPPPLLSHRRVDHVKPSRTPETAFPPVGPRACPECSTLEAEEPAAVAGAALADQ